MSLYIRDKCRLLQNNERRSKQELDSNKLLKPTTGKTMSFFLVLRVGLPNLGAACRSYCILDTDALVECDVTVTLRFLQMASRIKFFTPILPGCKDHSQRVLYPLAPPSAGHFEHADIDTT